MIDLSRLKFNLWFMKINPQYITDQNGNKLYVIISIEEFEYLIEQLEELEDIRLYDESKNDDSEESISMEEAFQIIENERNKI